MNAVRKYQPGDLVKVRTTWGTMLASVVEHDILEGWDADEECWVFDSTVQVFTSDERCPFTNGRMAIDAARVELVG